MVKAVVDEETNDFIETVQERQGLNKEDATAFVLESAKDIGGFGKDE